MTAAKQNYDIKPRQSDMDYAKKLSKIVPKHENGKMQSSFQQAIQFAINTIASGKELYIFSENSELTSQEAADILNVSRPFLIKLLEDGEIRYRKVGHFRRINTKDVLDYKKMNYDRREKALNKLSSIDQEIGLDY